MYKIRKQGNLGLCATNDSFLDSIDLNFSESDFCLFWSFLDAMSKCMTRTLKDDVEAHMRVEDLAASSHLFDDCDIAENEQHVHEFSFFLFFEDFPYVFMFFISDFLKASFRRFFFTKKRTTNEQANQKKRKKYPSTIFSLSSLSVFVSLFLIRVYGRNSKRYSRRVKNVKKRCMNDKKKPLRVHLEIMILSNLLILASFPMLNL